MNKITSDTTDTTDAVSTNTNIEFKKLTLKNFMSYGNKVHEVYFDNTMTLITGKNGNGKTTQFIALFYALFGKPYKKVKLTSLINNINLKELVVTLDFEINGIKYFIIRGQKPNIFEIHKEGVMLDQFSSNTEYQEYLENNILKFNEHTFKQLIFLGANINTTKSFVDLTKAEKEELFQTITDTAVFGQLKEKIKEKIKENVTQKTELEYKISVTKELIQSESTSLQKLEDQNKVIKQTLLETTQENANDILTLTNEIEKLEHQINLAKNIKENYLQNKEKLEKLEQLFNKIVTKEQDVIVKLKQIESMENTYSTCIGCENLKLISSVDITKKNELSALLDKIQDKKQKEQTEITNLKVVINNDMEILQHAKSLKSVLDIKVLELGKKKQDTNNYQLIEIDYSNLNANKEKLIELENKLSEINDIIDKYKRLDKLFDNNNIKGLIIKQSLPLLNKFINMYLETFSQFDFKFNVDSDFTVSIKQKNKIDYEFQSLSNGQSMRISFSIIFAFLKLIETRNGITTNLLVLDEILDSSLDYDGRMELLEIIRNNFYNKSVFVISHNTDIINTEFFSKAILVETENGFSKNTIIH